MKHFIWFAFLVLHGAAPVFAASGECRLLPSRAERNACYQQQQKPVAAKGAEAASDRDKLINAVERMKVEDDRLTRRLQGICRGC